MRRLLSGVIVAGILACVGACYPGGEQCHDWVADTADLVTLLGSDVVDPSQADAIAQQIHDNTLNYATYCELG